VLYLRIKIQKQSAMSNLSLKEHYERKYQEENIVESIPSINEVDIPRDRFEAALKFFPKYFKGEEILELGAGDGRVAKALLLKDQSIQKYTLGDISRPRLN
jgi:ubiquinone/menaquinone biosynthesis C-methylase UbiE